MSETLSARIISEVCRLGASVAATLSMADLLQTPSQAGRPHPLWPEWSFTALIFGLNHPPGNPALDFWGGKRGTIGNRRLVGIAHRMIAWLSAELGIRAQNLPYRPDSGGVFLKEVAAGAGLGVIGRNNLLVSPVYGPRLRLRALMMDCPAGPAPEPVGFDPCRGCDAPCRRRCPQNAFDGGGYRLDRCRHQMQLDQHCRMPPATAGIIAAGRYLVRFCRACELACPVGGEGR